VSAAPQQAPLRREPTPALRAPVETHARERPPAANGAARATLADRLFAAAFQRLFAFQLLYEDSEVDNGVLSLRPDSRILAISGGGCGVAGLLAAHPERIDAADINRHHLALTAAKVAAVRRMTSHDELYQLFGRGSHHDPARALASLSDGLPPWMGRYWRTHHARFRRNLYAEGLAGTFQRWLRETTGLDGAFLRALQPLDRQERLLRLRPALVSLRRSRLFRLVADTPFFLLGHGINFVQRQRNLDAHRTDTMVDVVTAVLERLVETDLETNWFAWVGLTGGFNHDHPEAVPPYLRAENHRRALEAPTRVAFHDAPLHDVLRAAPSGHWTHFSLCDLLDWLPDPVQRSFLLEIARAGGPGAIVLTRTVEHHCTIERLGLGRTYERLEPQSTEASLQERTKLYARVNVYRVVDPSGGGRRL
jgi:S-adenosylmethionine-diacylglycerol 3-amino-3-carboxypropyl transferase